MYESNGYITSRDNTLTECTQESAAVSKEIYSMNLLSAQQNKASILKKSKAKFNVFLKLTAHWLQTTSV